MDLINTELLMLWLVEHDYKMEITKSTSTDGDLNIDVYDIAERHVTGYLVDTLAEFYELLQDNEPELL